MTSFQSTKRNRVRRLADRGDYSRETIERILDEALICHVGFVQEGQPFVIPCLFAHAGDTLYLHGAPASRMLKHLRTGGEACVEVTLLDGIVFARSAFHHSMNYRSVVLFGKGRAVDAAEERLRALRSISDHVARGRWEEARKPSREELKATSVVAIEIESGSAKIRSGPPSDEEQDYTLPVWAGVLPLALRPSAPEKDPRLPEGISIPIYIRDYSRGKGL